jgi:ubiquitin carboxyl-terminal hydrolase 8
MNVEKGLTGLANLGNTCFMNTCIQILSHTPELYDCVSSKKTNPGELLHEWIELRKIMWDSNCTISPGGWVRSVQVTAHKKDMMLFTGFAQNDLPEFLLFMINTFHETLSRKVNMNIKGQSENETDDMAVKCYTMMKNMYQKEYSELLNLFFGIHVSQIVDPDTNKVLSNAPEPYFVIELPIPSNKKQVTIYDCFKHYYSPETLEGENAWYNEKTKKKEKVHKRMIFWNLPNILVVALKRFNNQNRKLNTLVETPLDNIDLSEYVHGYNKESYNYELYGIANHSGNALGGHYYAYVKTINNNWYVFNDTSVSTIAEKDLINSSAYVLFYRKKKID